MEGENLPKCFSIAKNSIHLYGIQPKSVESISLWGEIPQKNSGSSSSQSDTRITMVSEKLENPNEASQLPTAVGTQTPESEEFEKALNLVLWEPSLSHSDREDLEKLSAFSCEWVAE